MHIQDIVRFVKNLFVGRISRANFFWGTVFSWLIFALLFVFYIFLLSNLTATVCIIIAIPVILINLGLHIRRLHDVDLRGWWVLIFLIIPRNFKPIASAVLFFWEGDNEANRYGPVPPKRQLFKDILNI